MIHELLLNLWHHPGNIGFADDRDWTHLFELPQFLHPGEKNLLQTILEIGIEYHRIVAFTNEVLNQTFTPKERNPWQKLQLHFEIEWPLHIVFHPEVMQCYNKLFSFLLRLKKTQINLFKLWKEHTFSKHKIDRRVWTLRHTLMFLVNNLQYYMQVNVIESQFSTLLKAVESANEFEDIIKIHHDFVTNLLSKTFVLSPDEPQESQSKHKLYKIPALQQNLPSKVYNVITELLSLCDEFCLIAGTWEAELTEPNLEQLEDFQKKSNNAVESLLTVLYTMYRKISGGHLLQLLLLLDFNGYFSESKADLNLTEFFS
ncbi:gamma-tubulin complex component 4 isoform X3 [Anthonomus grandis grandis]|uniref:gamma-tubulin complex component 4 isoform X3 n=1 Tax=Anthonomus grandis grandis TaxID=2921223 RepID=UPI002165066A|nr:gamma-tubulin complex component 4 isoform X3 [Anthonomus grandis grandis]